MQGKEKRKRERKERLNHGYSIILQYILYFRIVFIEKHIVFNVDTQKKSLDVSFLMVKSSPTVLYLGKVTLMNIAEATESAVTFGWTICYLSLTL